MKFKDMSWRILNKGEVEDLIRRLQLTNYFGEIKIGPFLKISKTNLFRINVKNMFKYDVLEECKIVNAATEKELNILTLSVFLKSIINHSFFYSFDHLEHTIYKVFTDTFNIDVYNSICVDQDGCLNDFSLEGTNYYITRIIPNGDYSYLITPDFKHGVFGDMDSSDIIIFGCEISNDEAQHFKNLVDIPR